MYLALAFALLFLYFLGFLLVERFLVDVPVERYVPLRLALYLVRIVEHLFGLQVGESDSMEEVMRKFDLKGTRYMPVVNVSGHLTGYISRSRAYSMYRKMVADFSAE